MKIKIKNPYMIGIIITVVIALGISTVLILSYMKPIKETSSLKPKIIGKIRKEGTGNNLNDMPMMKELSERAGLDIEFDMMELSQNCRRCQGGGMISKDIDFIMGKGIEHGLMKKIIDAKDVIPLKALIKKHAPNISAFFEDYPEVYQAIQYTDGEIYGLPLYDERGEYLQNKYLFINKQWLENLGLVVPRTVEEFYEVLVAFKTQDPNGNGKDDEIPFTFLENTCEQDINLMMGWWGLGMNQEQINIKDERITFGPTEEVYKEGIKYFNKLYKEDLIDKEIFTQDSKNLGYKGLHRPQVYGAFLAHRAEDIVGKQMADTDYIVVPPLTGGVEQPVWDERKGNRINKNKFVITQYNDYPEETIRWIDQFFDPENFLEIEYGKIGELLFENEEGVYEYKEEVIKDSYWEIRLNNSLTQYVPGFKSEEVHSKVNMDFILKPVQKSYDSYKDYMVGGEVSRAEISEKLYELPQMKTIENEISFYTNEMRLRWITGERNIEREWETYKQVLNNIGLSEYLEAYQEAVECVLEETKETNSSSKDNVN